MATTNIWQQFKGLLPEGIQIVATITANNNGINQAELQDGSVITVKGECGCWWESVYSRWGG